MKSELLIQNVVTDTLQCTYLYISEHTGQTRACNGVKTTLEKQGPHCRTCSTQKFEAVIPIITNTVVKRIVLCVSLR